MYCNVMCVYDKHAMDDYGNIAENIHYTLYNGNDELLVCYQLLFVNRISVRHTLASKLSTLVVDLKKIV